MNLSGDIELLKTFSLTDPSHNVNIITIAGVDYKNKFFYTTPRRQAQASPLDFTKYDFEGNVIGTKSTGYVSDYDFDWIKVTEDGSEIIFMRKDSSQRYVTKLIIDHDDFSSSTLVDSSVLNGLPSNSNINSVNVIGWVDDEIFLILGQINTNNSLKRVKINSVTGNIISELDSNYRGSFGNYFDENNLVSHHHIVNNNLSSGTIEVFDWDNMSVVNSFTIDEFYFPGFRKTEHGYLGLNFNDHNEARLYRYDFFGNSRGTLSYPFDLRFQIFSMICWVDETSFGSVARNSTEYAIYNLSQKNVDKPKFSGETDLKSTFFTNISGQVVDTYMAGVDEDLNYLYNTRLYPELNPVNYDGQVYMYRTDLDGNNIETWTSPAGISVINRSTGLLNKEKTHIYFGGRVMDYVTGESNPDGYSWKVVRLEIDQNNFSNSTLSYFDSGHSAAGYVEVFDVHDGKIDCVMIAGNSAHYRIYEDGTTPFESNALGGLARGYYREPNSDTLYYIKIVGGISYLDTWNLSTRTFIGTASNSFTRNARFKILSVINGVIKCFSDTIGEFILFEESYDLNFNLIKSINSGDRNTTSTNYIYLPIIGDKSGVIYSLSRNGISYNKYRKSQKNVEKPKFNGDIGLVSTQFQSGTQLFENNVHNILIDNARGLFYRLWSNHYLNSTMIEMYDFDNNLLGTWNTPVDMVVGHGALSRWNFVDDSKKQLVILLRYPADLPSRFRVCILDIDFNTFSNSSISSISTGQRSVGNAGNSFNCLGVIDQDELCFIDGRGSATNIYFGRIDITDNSTIQQTTGTGLNYTIGQTSFSHFRKKGICFAKQFGTANGKIIVFDFVNNTFSESTNHISSALYGFFGSFLIDVDWENELVELLHSEGDSLTFKKITADFNLNILREEDTPFSPNGLGQFRNLYSFKLNKELHTHFYGMWILNHSQLNIR